MDLFQFTVYLAARVSRAAFVYYLTNGRKHHPESHEQI